MKYQYIPFGKGKNRILFVHFKRAGQNQLSGMITGKRLQGANIALTVCEEENIEDYEFACLSLLSDHRISSIQMEREIFYGVKQGNPMARTILFHELGHYIHGDLLGDGFDQDDYQRRREETVKNGSVIEEELRADDFAVQYFGCNYVANALSMLKDKIQKRSDEDSELAVKELALRIDRFRSQN